MRLRKGGDILLLDGEARGELVPAEADEQVAARLERGKEVEAAIAAAGALAPCRRARWIMKLGQENFSERREATMPTTP